MAPGQVLVDDRFRMPRKDRPAETTPSVHLEALSEISQAITSETYLDDILRLIVVVTAKVMGSNICSLMLLNEQTG